MAWSLAACILFSDTTVKHCKTKQNKTQQKQAATIATLRFAHRAKSIKNKATINRRETRSQLEAKIARLLKKNEELAKLVKRGGTLPGSSGNKGNKNNNNNNSNNNNGGGKRMSIKINGNDVASVANGETEKLLGEEKKKNESLQQEIADWEAKESERKEKYENLLLENTNLKESISQYEEDLKTKDAMIKELSREIEKLTKNLSNSEMEIATLKETINTLNKMSVAASSSNQNNNLNAPALMAEHSKQLTDIFNTHVNSQNTQNDNVLAQLTSMVCFFQCFYISL